MSRDISFQGVRAEQYKDKINRWPYIRDWSRNPYTSVKSIFYIETSSALVYFLLRTRIKPNTLTVIYGFSGIVGGVLLAIPNNYTIGAGVIIFFLKGIIDWSDGLLANLTRQESLTGHLVDIYGGKLGSMGFFMGLGFYVAAKTEILLFYYLLPLIPISEALLLTQFGKAQLFNVLSSKKQIDKWKKKKEQDRLEQGSKPIDDLLGANNKKYYEFVVSFLDGRARTVDLICLVIVLEMFYPINLSWIFFLLLTIKGFVIFFGSFYLLSKGGWAENALDEKMTQFFHLSQDEENQGL